MIIREYVESDLKVLEGLHEKSGFEYSLPAPTSEKFFFRGVVEDDSGIAMAAFLRLNAEAFLLCNADWRTPAWRYEAFRQLSGVGAEAARKAGAWDINAFLPPKIGKQFGKRLNRMGWSSYKGEEWRCYSLPVREEN